MAAMTYDPKKVFVSYGPAPLGDFAEGSFITCEPDQDDYTTKRGTDGRVDFVRNIGRTFTVRIRILQTSVFNDALSAARLLDLTSNTGPLPLIIKDLQGLSLQFFPQARIMGNPMLAYGDTAEAREWVFKCTNGDMFIGGNLIN